MLPWPDQQLLLALCYPFMDYGNAPRYQRIFPDDDFAAWRANIDDDGHSIARGTDGFGCIPCLAGNGALVKL